MSKELEVLLDLKEKHYRGYLTNDEYIEKINEVLSNYVNDYNNAEPSEALEHFNHFEKWYRKICYRVVTSFELDYDLDTIKQSLIEFQRLDSLLRLPSEQSSSHFTYKDKNLVCMQKIKYRKLITQENVLKLIKEKNVNIQYLKRCKDVKQYNRSALLYEELLDEEFNLLKEVFKDE